MSNGRGVRVHSARLRNHRVMLLLVLLLASSGTVRVPSAHAAQTYIECVDEAWNDYNTCLVKGRMLCDLKFLFDMSVCYVIPGPYQ